MLIIYAFAVAAPRWIEPPVNDTHESSLPSTAPPVAFKAVALDDSETCLPLSSEASGRVKTLGPNDLPGYTGWARPQESIAPMLGVAGPSTASIEVSRPATFRIECLQGDKRCHSGGAGLYIRFYGPALQTPDAIVDYRNGTYSIEVTFHDPGHWFMEAVVEYSVAPPQSAIFPNEIEEKYYEGYPIPGSPLPFRVADAPPQSAIFPNGIEEKYYEGYPIPGSPLPFVRGACMPAQLSGLRGRWKLIGRMQPWNSISKHQKADVNMALLGLRFGFEPYTCSLLPMEQLLEKCGQHLPAQQQIVLVGDSTMRVQLEVLKAQQQTCGPGHPLKQWNVHYIRTDGGLRLTIDHVVQELRSIRERYRNTPMAVLFNSGLHDTDKYCGVGGWVKWREAQKLNITDCVEQYGELFERLQDAMLRLQPRPLLMFRSSTSAWQKWGNWGFT